MSDATREYAKALYGILEEQSTIEAVAGGANGDEATEVRVWRGSLTDVFKGMGLSQVYYSRIRNIFKEYDCVTYLRIGTRAYDSVLVLNHPPPEEISADLLTPPSASVTLGTLNERLTDAEQDIEALEAWRQTLGGINIAEALLNLEKRLAKVEGKRVKREASNNGKDS